MEDVLVVIYGGGQVEIDVSKICKEGEGEKSDREIRSEIDLKVKKEQRGMREQLISQQGLISISLYSFSFGYISLRDFIKRVLPFVHTSLVTFLLYNLLKLFSRHHLTRYFLSILLSGFRMCRWRNE